MANLSTNASGLICNQYKWHCHHQPLQLVLGILCCVLPHHAPLCCTIFYFGAPSPHYGKVDRRSVCSVSAAGRHGIRSRASVSMALHPGRSVSTRRLAGMTNVSDLHQFRVRTPSFLITADYPAQVFNSAKGFATSKY